MAPSLARIPPGTQTFFDAAVRRRRAVEAAVLGVFAGWSYDEIWLPAFDYLDLFARGMGSWAPEKTYKFIDREGRVLALRPDFTSLVARTVATRFGDRPRPIRLCYSGEVFRYDEPRHGRQDEFHQIGIEQTGSARLAADLEVLLVACEALRAAGVARPVIGLSHAGFHRSLLDASDLGPDETRAVREHWRRRSAPDLARYLEGLGRPGDPLAEVPLLAGAEGVRRARSLGPGPAGLAALDALERLAAALGTLGGGAELQLDLGDAPALDYYTGMTFRAFGPRAAVELGSGGRYDDLLGALGKPEPAVGMVLFLDTLLEAGALPPADAAPATPVPCGADLAASFGAALAHRARGLPVRMDPGSAAPPGAPGHA